MKGLVLFDCPQAYLHPTKIIQVPFGCLISDNRSVSPSRSGGSQLLVNTLPPQQFETSRIFSQTSKISTPPHCSISPQSCNLYKVSHQVWMQQINFSKVKSDVADKTCYDSFNANVVFETLQPFSCNSCYLVLTSDVGHSTHPRWMWPFWGFGVVAFEMAGMQTGETVSNYVQPIHACRGPGLIAWGDQELLSHPVGSWLTDSLSRKKVKPVILGLCLFVFCFLWEVELNMAICKYMWTWTKSVWHNRSFIEVQLRTQFTHSLHISFV